MELVENRKYYTYSDVTIIPGIVSDIEHRSECLVYNDDGKLPLFTAPMDTVVNEENFGLFEKNHINAILPRTVPIDTRIWYSQTNRWAAYSLNEFQEIYCDKNHKQGNKPKVLIDVANGHMQKIIDLVKEARSIYLNDIVIMVGNIANPKTYERLARAGVDYVRCGIGSGCGCLSTSNTGIHMPMATLINDIAKLKEEIKDDYRHLPYIVADGGIRGYSDVIKALALGADYVMIGSVFAKMEESAAPKEVNEFGEMFATFYGMASREGQIALNGAKTKTSEGLKKSLKVEYSMAGWTKNFIDYLRSAMSYVGADTLDSFRFRSVLIVNSENAIKAVNK